MKKIKTNKKIKINKDTKLACEDYNAILDLKREVDAEIARVQREKDLEVDSINKYYENILDKLMRKQDEINIIIANTQAYVAKNR